MNVMMWAGSVGRVDMVVPAYLPNEIRQCVQRPHRNEYTIYEEEGGGGLFWKFPKWRETCAIQLSRSTPKNKLPLVSVSEWCLGAFFLWASATNFPHRRPGKAGSQEIKGHLI